MKRLLCIVWGMNAGGAETFLMKVYRAINRSKIQMDFAVNIKTKGFYDDEIRQMGGRIHYFPAKSESLKDYKIGLTRIIHENHYDSVLRITSNGMGFLDLAIAKKAGAKLCIARSSNSSDGGGLKSRLAHLFGKLLYKKYVDVKIAPSMLAAEYTFGKRDVRNGLVYILPNGLELKKFQFSEEGRLKIRSEFGIPADAFVVGHVGRFNKQKNHLFLLDIFKKLYKRKKNAVLLLVGSGELESAMRDNVVQYGLEKMVFFAGVRFDMPNLLSAMDVFVFPSLYEGMPNAVIEAQACGISCYVSDSITKEANITGLVRYLSINNSDVWVESLESLKQNKFVDTHNFFIEKKYDIQSTVVFFEEKILNKSIR